MPKISVHLEADSPEEFRALLAAFQLQATPPPPPAQGDDLTRMYEGVSRIAAKIIAEEPVETPAEPMKPKRGRPFKTVPVEPEPPVAVQPGPEVAQPAAEVVAAPEVAAPKPAKPKAMPHAQPENGAATRQDLLDAFSEYVQRYGASFGFSDISSLLQKNLGDGVRKASDVPEDKLPVAIGAIKTAIADNPFNRKRDYA